MYNLYVLKKINKIIIYNFQQLLCSQFSYAHTALHSFIPQLLSAIHTSASAHKSAFPFLSFCGSHENVLHRPPITNYAFIIDWGPWLLCIEIHGQLHNKAMHPWAISQHCVCMAEMLRQIHSWKTCTPLSAEFGSRILNGLAEAPSDYTSGQTRFYPIVHPSL